MEEMTVPRAVEVIITPDKSEALISEARQIPGIISVVIQKGGAIEPAGDVISLVVTARDLPVLMRILDKYGLGSEDGPCISTSQPLGVVSHRQAESISDDSNLASWEEMEGEMGRESNMTPATVVLMFISGVFATVGLSNNSLHTVIAAMVIAPGFEPFVRIAHGMIAHATTWRRGVRDAFLGYLALFVGAAITAIFLKLNGHSSLGSEASYLAPNALISYWSAINPQMLLINLAAGVGGAILIATNRAILTGGVMIALSLIPALAISAIGLVELQYHLIGRGLFNWLIDALLVIIGSLAVFAWKRWAIDYRVMA